MREKPSTMHSLESAAPSTAQSWSLLIINSMTRLISAACIWGFASLSTPLTLFISNLRSANRLLQLCQYNGGTDLVSNLTISRRLYQIGAACCLPRSSASQTIHRDVERWVGAVWSSSNELVLHDACPVSSFEAVQRQLEYAGIDSLLTYVHPTPIGSASLSQVCRWLMLTHSAFHL